MPNAQNLTIRIPPNPLAGTVIREARPQYRQPPRSVLKMLQLNHAMKPRTH